MTPRCGAVLYFTAETIPITFGAFEALLRLRQQLLACSDPLFLAEITS
jgi:hypothetical protein